MTPPTVSMARLDAVLRDQYRIMAGRRQKILAHVFGGKGVVMVAHLVSRMQEEPWHWTEPEATQLGKAVRE